MSDRQKLHTWSALSHKQAMGGTIAVDGLAPTWVPADEQTRLTAYTILQAYLDNVARWYVQPGPATDDGKDPRDDRREYGDAALLVDQALAALLGEEQTIVVEHADDVDDLEQDATAEDRALQAEAAAALERQDWLREWATAESFMRRMASVERKAVGLGDGIYQLTWDSAKQRVRVTTWNPGFYFPVLDPKGSADEYPAALHLAYDFEVGKPKRRYVRRITYRLGPIRPQMDPVDPDRVMPLFDDDGQVVLRRGDTLDQRTGRIVRRYPWQDAGEQPSDTTCYMTDGVWDITETKGITDLADLADDAAQYEITTDADGTPVLVRELDLMQDFIPVVHIPNTGDTEEHYGRSMLLKVAQILDDIASTDSDLSAASRTTGTPPLLVHSRPAGAPAPAGMSLVDRAKAATGRIFSSSAADQETVTPGPGAQLDVGSAKAEYLDTSKSLDALLKLQGSLLSRLSVNSRMPESVLGRTKIDGQLAGITLALSFGPLRSLVREMRQVRDEKNPLVLRFVQRMAMAGGALPPGRVLPATVELGSYLPTDLQQLVELVTKLLAAGAISRLTAITMLVDGGLPIDDAAAEVARVEQADFEGADKLADVDMTAARRYLGLEDETTAPPEIEV